MMRTFKEYAAFYEKHAGKLSLNPKYKLYFDPDYGFSEFKISGKFLFAGAMAGDMDHWLEMAKRMCKEYDLVSMTTFTPRNIKAYLRRIGFTITEAIQKDGYIDYHAKNKDGDNLLAEQIDGGYLLTWEVK